MVIDHSHKICASFHPRIRHSLVLFIYHIFKALVIVLPLTAPPLHSGCETSAWNIAPINSINSQFQAPILRHTLDKNMNFSSTHWDLLTPQQLLVDVITRRMECSSSGVAAAVTSCAHIYKYSFDSLKIKLENLATWQRFFSWFVAILIPVPRHQPPACQSQSQAPPTFSHADVHVSFLPE